MASPSRRTASALASSKAQASPTAARMSASAELPGKRQFGFLMKSAVGVAALLTMARVWPNCTLDSTSSDAETMASQPITRSAIAEKQRWIFAKLAEWHTSAARRVLPPMRWEDGATLPFLGKPVTLKLESPIGALVFDADMRTLHLGLPPTATGQQIKDRVQGWLQTQARRLFGERLDVYAERLGVRHSAYALSSAATRWGSCTADGKIRLNWRLVHFPLSLIDYVVAHELAHLKEMNHSPRFWDTVESIFPEFREAREQLRSHPPEYLPVF
ncbi:M48 family metallopeptidase [Ralstonia pseudosolanacearum]|uniref:M48 family metallopeptidase n=1 Tax=Ralstonia pseudosolanacearum TaxID=1310165 RepID=UPI003D18008C